MRYILTPIAVALCLATASEAPAQAAAEVLRLEVRVIGDYGQPLDGAEVSRFA